MNGQWTDVENWLDLLDHIWIGLVLIIATAIPSVMAARNHRGIKDIKDQVVNGHKDAPPLRADLDKALSAIEDLAHDVRGLRQDIATEEDRRRTQINAVYDELERRRH